MQPVKINRDGLEEVLVDGALVCNFPLHCFDGELQAVVQTISQFPSMQVGSYR
jgi:predicted acylesterase/phospholipase RssA